MKKRRKLRGYVIPSICLVLISAIVFSSYKMYEILSFAANDNESAIINTINPTDEENVIPTLNESEKIIRPYNAATVNASIPFYNVEGTDEEQTSALIFYEGIYMQNTGVLYTSDEQFDVLAVLDGTVKDIKEDSIMGNIIEIENSSKLTTIYQSLGEVKVTIGSTITQGDVIATSGENKLNTDKNNCLHFEVFYDGSLINPEEFYLYNYDEVMK